MEALKITILPRMRLLLERISLRLWRYDFATQSLMLDMNKPNFQTWPSLGIHCQNKFVDRSTIRQLSRKNSQPGRLVTAKNEGATDEPIYLFTLQKYRLIFHHAAFSSMICMSLCNTIYMYICNQLLAQSLLHHCRSQNRDLAIM